MSNSNILNYLSYGVLVMLIFLTGFYFGYKNRDSRISKDFSEQIVIQTNISSESNKIEGVIQGVSEVKNPEGVFWIKLGEEPICPKSHPIKGKYKDSSKVFYMPDNKSYTRVKPDLCFATEDFAIKQAGFINQF